MPPDGDGPALTLHEQVGTGAHTEVWRARDDEGQLVVLKRLRPDAPPWAAADLRREGELLGRLDSPYLVRLRAVVDDGPRPALVLDEADGGSLDRLLAVRGRLLPGEVVTVGVPLALALAALHDAGALHGDLRPSCVLLTADGMPLLSGLGRSPGAGATPGADVRALAGLCVLLLTGRVAAGGALGPDVPPELCAVLAPALGEAPGTAHALARALRGSGAPLPLRLLEDEASGVVAAGVEPSPSPPALVPFSVAARCVGVGRGAHARRARPRVVLAALGGAGLVAAAGLGWQLGRTGPPASAAALAPRVDASSATPAPTSSSSPSPSTTAPTAAAPASRQLAHRSAPAEPDWTAVLDRLDAARSASLARADAAALRDVDAPDSAALEADLAAVGQLRAATQTAHGLRHRLVDVQVRSLVGGTVRLRVRDVLLPYDVVGPDGSHRRPGRPERSFEIVLTRSSAGYRLAEVRPA